MMTPAILAIAIALQGHAIKVSTFEVESMKRCKAIAASVNEQAKKVDTLKIAASCLPAETQEKDKR